MLAGNRFMITLTRAPHHPLCMYSTQYTHSSHPAVLYYMFIKNRVRAPTHHTGNKSPDTRRGSLASLAIHNPCRSRFIAFKRLCIHCTQVNILRLQVTLKPLSPSLHLATCVVKVACMSSYALKQRWCTQICK